MDDEVEDGHDPGRGRILGLFRRHSSSLGSALAAAYAGYVFVLAVVCLIGVLAAVAFASAQPGSGWTVFAVAVMLGAAGMLSGGFVGFLFALPRSVTVGGVGQGGTGEITVRPNTNLEDISDWVTKIVVGLTLVQIGKIPGALGELFGYAGGALGPGRTPVVFAGGLLVYCAVNGSIAGWVGTRLFLGRLMQVSDRPIQEAARQAAAHGHPLDAQRLATEASSRRERAAEAVVSPARP